MRMAEISIGNNYASKVIEILEFSENDLTHTVIWYLKTKKHEENHFWVIFPSEA